MRYILAIISIMVLLGCINHEQEEVITIVQSESTEEIEIKYAEGFEIDYQEDYIKVVTKSFGENTPFRDSIYIPRTQNLIELPKETKRMNKAIESVACQSVTHLAFLDKLDNINSVSGVCGLKYVNDTNVKLNLEEQGAQEICLEEGMIEETILNLSPDLFFLYPFGSDFGSSYTKKGVNTLLIGEYLEQSQLARLEWIKLFGVLFNKVNEANKYFAQVEQEYYSLVVDADPENSKSFIMNLPFKENWFMPSSNSVGVELIEDAGLSFYYGGDEGTENNLRSLEEVWEDGAEANYWVIIAQRPAGFSLDDLLKEESAYAAFKSVQDRNVLFCNTSETDYFAKGVVEPNIVLMDLLYATGQQPDHQPKYFFRLE